MAGIDTERPGGSPRLDSRPPGPQEIVPVPGDGRAARRLAARLDGWLVAAGPAVAALISYGYRLGGPPLWRDEATTKEMSARPVHEILATLRHYDVVHGAYYLVMHYAERVTGNSDAALRVPSLLAMVLACAFTALAARRLATASGAPWPRFTGATSGLAFALLPGAVRYAQEARSYAIVTMGAAIATYLLLRAAQASGHWWAWYGVTVAVLGVVNIAGLLILVAHGLSLVIAGPGGKGGYRGKWARLAGRGRLSARLPPAGWIAAAALAVTAAAPVLALAYRQRAALTWKSPPPIGLTAVRVMRFWTGSWGMAVLACVLVIVCAVAAAHASAHASGQARPVSRRLPLPDATGAQGTSPRHGVPGAVPLGVISVALPLLVMPVVVLLAISQAVPVYDNRYVEFCLPALAILIGCGLSWVWRLAAIPALRRARIGWLPAVAAGAALLMLTVPGDALVRQPGARGDDLELATRIIADNARPGDIVLYVPVGYRTVAMPFPGPWRTLRDIALRKSPARSNTLYGSNVTPAQLRARFTHVTRVWLITPPAVNCAVLVRHSPLYAAEARLVAGFRLIHRWRDHDVIITLYTAWHRSAAAGLPGGCAAS